MKLNDIVSHFQIDGDVQEIKPFGGGLINSTYRVVTAAGQADYLLQSVNQAVFPGIAELAENIDRITAHIRKKLAGMYSAEELDRRVLRVIPSKEAKPYILDDKGGCWRVFLFISDSVSYERLENQDQAEEMGKAFAHYQEMLADLPEPQLHEVLPGFHNTSNRIDTFKNSVATDKAGRLNEVREEVDFLLSMEEEMRSVVQRGEAGVIPVRTVHQDTKLSNILFDQDGKALCVIDLDTTMPGYACYDFGDAIRVGANNGLEDDEDLSRVGLNLDLFKGFARGYVKGAAEFITEAEVDTLAFGAKLLTYEQSVRFLDDYLNGDVYYKTTKEKHNLIRTRAQIAYLKDLIVHFDEMESYVKSIYTKELV